MITPGRARAGQAAVVAQDSSRRWPGTLTGARPTSDGLDSVAQALASWQSGWWPLAFQRDNGLLERRFLQGLEVGVAGS